MFLDLLLYVESSYDYKASLLRLTVSRSSSENLDEAVRLEHRLMPPASSYLYESMSLSNNNNNWLREHSYTMQLLKRYPETSDHLAVSTSPDGNCMFNAVSILISGDVKYV